MASPSQDPDAVAGTPMGGEHGGNTEQPEVQSEAPQDAAQYEPQGINPFADEAHQESAGKPTSAGSARAKKATGGTAK